MYISILSNKKSSLRDDSTIYIQASIASNVRNYFIVEFQSSEVSKREICEAI